MAKDNKVDETKPEKASKTHSNPLLLSLKAQMQNARRLFGLQLRKQ